MSFDLSKTVERMKELFKKDEKRADQFGLGDSLEKVSSNPSDYIVLPEWWKTHFGIIGIPFGKWIQLSGKPDSGKTTTCLEAIKQAQLQNHIVIYVETEGKTTPEDLITYGIDPNGVMTICTNITEELWENVNTALDVIKDTYPDAKVLLVIDSYGNTTSMRDSEMKFTESSGMVGGQAKTNRAGIQSIVAKQLQQDIAVLVVNYSYANIGSVGETNAGGRALEFIAALIINCSRVSDYTKTVKGKTVKAGINTRFRVTKNHFAKALKDEEGKAILLPKDCNLRITSEGISVVESKGE
ncbi:MAG: Protein RecA [Candidatus Omnitrophica bacterium]|nr:Protein RecA [Candidatus Omnitrophota bacterium]